MMDRQLSKSFAFCLLLFFLMPFMACDVESQLLTRAERARVDTLVARQNKINRVVLDSLCDGQFDSLVNRAKDSILQIRLKEIESLFKRN
ncbi:MAG: hypothetical protein AAF985_04215 [Bacteroidota bacterium]